MIKNVLSILLVMGLVGWASIIVIDYGVFIDFLKKNNCSLFEDRGLTSAIAIPEPQIMTPMHSKAWACTSDRGQRFILMR